jgi:hypothetical protein
VFIAHFQGQIDAKRSNTSTEIRISERKINVEQAHLNLKILEKTLTDA